MDLFLYDKDLCRKDLKRLACGTTHFVFFFCAEVYLEPCETVVNYFCKKAIPLVCIIYDGAIAHFLKVVN